MHNNKVTLEKEIERRLGEELKAMGCLFYKFVSPGNQGVPDRIIVTPCGRVAFVELKTDHGHLTSIQLRQIKRLEKHGATVFVLYGEEHMARLLSWIRRLEGLTYDV